MVTAMHETVPRHVALRKSALLDHLSEAILAVSRKGDIFPVNNAGLKLLALTGRSVKKLKEILFSELSLPRVLEAGDATEIRLRKLNIADHTYLIDSFFDGADLVLLLSDITDVKKMAEDLSQQFTHLLRFKMSMQCITDGIVITDAFERVVFMNATMHDILSSQHKKYEVRTLKDLELLLGIFSENEEGASLPLGQIAALYWINVSLIGGQIFPIELFGLEFEVCEQGLALLSLVPIWLYRGRQGHHSKAFQYACYAFYPVHMLILGLIQLSL